MALSADPILSLKRTLTRTRQSDVVYSFLRSPLAISAAVVSVLLIVSAILAPLITPQDPFDPLSLNLMDAFTPPVWSEGGTMPFVLGTDDQGRDMFSAILYGMRISLTVGFAAVLFSIGLGVAIGLLSGYFGGFMAAVAMRLADVQLTIPAILIALMIDGLARAILPGGIQEDVAIYVLIIAIGIADWPQYARVVRGVTLVEREKEYVLAARLIRVPPITILIRHILPNVMGPVLVLGTLGLALAIIAEATLSFLGVGMPPTTPSLGTLIKTGNDFLFSGEWWITMFPALALVALVLSVNIIGDWLRDTLNPKLR